MSSASECDLCGTLFKQRPRNVSLDVNIRNAHGTRTEWSEVDLCGTCSEKLLTLIGPALRDFDTEAPPP